MGRLDGQIVIVTGAGRGIGRAYAEFLAGEGAAVVVNDKGGSPTGLGSEEAPAAEAAAAIQALGGTAVPDTHDVATEHDAIIQTALDNFGRIDGLVNNAGIISTAEVEDMDREQIDRMLGVHVVGPLGLVRAAWPHMRKQGFGRIVNVSSSSVFGMGGAPLYPTAKSAMIGLTRALAVDGAPHDIKVNCVMPLAYSRLADSQAGLAEFMKANFPPELIAPFVGALLTRDAPCSGETFAVTGGRAARVFLGTVPGAAGLKTIDDCLDGIDAAMDMQGYIAPTSTEEEVGFEYHQLGFDIGGIDLAKLNTAATS